MILWCKYCHRHKRLREDKHERFYAEIRDEKLRLVADYWGIRTQEIPIKYCPKCGRKLGD